MWNKPPPDIKHKRPDEKTPLVQNRVPRKYLITPGRQPVQSADWPYVTTITHVLFTKNHTKHATARTIYKEGPMTANTSIVLRHVLPTIRYLLQTSNIPIFGYNCSQLPPTSYKSHLLYIALPVEIVYIILFPYMSNLFHTSHHVFYFPLKSYLPLDLPPKPLFLQHLFFTCHSSLSFSHPSF